MSPENREFLTKFRQQIHAVGAIWIMAGVVSLLVGLYVFFKDPEFLNIQSDVTIVLGFAWLVLGVLTCRKEMSALTDAQEGALHSFRRTYLEESL